MGQNIESDAKLRQRQALSVSIASMSQTEGLRGAILTLPNVTRCKTFENKTSTTDANGLPRNSLCVIVAGGDNQAIARLIHSKKSMGCALHGNTTVNVVNSYGVVDAIKFQRPNVKNISFKLAIAASASYSADTASSITDNLAGYVNSLDIGDKIMQNKLYGAANLFGAEQSRTFDVNSIIIVVDGSDQSGDYILPFGFVAFCDPTTIAIEVTGG